MCFNIFISKFGLLKIYNSVQNKNSQNYTKLNNIYSKLKNHIFLHLYNTDQINFKFRGTKKILL